MKISDVESDVELKNGAEFLVAGPEVAGQSL